MKTKISSLLTVLSVALICTTGFAQPKYRLSVVFSNSLPGEIPVACWQTLIEGDVITYGEIRGPESYFEEKQFQTTVDQSTTFSWGVYPSSTSSCNLKESDIPLESLRWKVHQTTFLQSYASLSICPLHRPTIRPLDTKPPFRKQMPVVLFADYNQADNYADADFVWEYSLDGISYSTYSQHGKFQLVQEEKSLLIRFSDIPNAELGKPIYFRLKYCDDFPIYKANGSAPVKVLFMPELPEFKDMLFFADVHCPNQAPQPLFVRFKQPMATTDTVTDVYLCQQVDASGKPLDRKDVDFTIEKNGITINFTDVLEDGDYFLMMEGFVDGIAASSSSTKIRVKNPPALQFEKTISPASGTEYHQGIPKITTDGKIEISIKNYVDNCSIFWNETAYKTSDTCFNNLTSGTYSTKIRYNANQCDTLLSSFVELSNNTLHVRIEEGSPIVCHGGSEGSLQTVVERAPANRKISFSWYKNGHVLPNETLPYLENLSAGTYFAVCESEGLQSTFSFTVKEPQPLKLTVKSVVHPLYYNSNDGHIHIEPIGGTPPYTYQWSNDSTNNMLANLSSGTFHVTVSDFNLCKQTLSIELLPCFPLTATLQQTASIRCFESNDAILQVSVKGGIPPYRYRWMHNNDTTSQQVGLAIGLYEIEVTDSRGARSFDRIHISQPESLSVVLSADSVSGWGTSDGSAHAVASGGTPPYTFEWGCSTAASITGLQAGTYHLKLTDANGCWLKDSISVKTPDSLTLSGQAYPCTYFGATLGIAPITPNDGRIDCRVDGGVKPYIYQWFYQRSDHEWIQLTSKHTSYIDSLTGGCYALLVTDSKGYSVSDTFVVVKKKPLTTAISATSPLCFGSSDGILQTSIEGGTPPYRHRWKHNNDTTLQQIGLAIGTYEIEVFDSCGVRSFDRIYISQPDPLNVVLSADSVSGWNASDGSVCAVASGGTPPYTFEWGCSTAASVTGLQAGTYHLKLTDANGCWLKDSISVKTPDSLTLSGQAYPCTYFGAIQGIAPIEPNNGRIDCRVSGGVKPYTYRWFHQWTNDEWIQLTSKNKPSLDSLTGGRYALLVTDSKGYSVSDTFVVVKKKPLTTTISATFPLCFGSSDGVLQALASGGTPPYSYRWNLGDSTVLLQGLTAGHYAVIVQDSLGVLSTFETVVTQPEPLTVECFTKEITGYGLNTGAIFSEVQGGTKPYSYLWTAHDTICRSSRALNISAGVYTLQVTDSNGCRWSSSFALNNPDVLEVSASVVKPVSYRGSVQGRSVPKHSDGELHLTASGGFPPYEYTWDNGAKTSYLTGLSEGSYSVTVVDKNGNEVYGTFHIKASEPLMLTVTQDSLIACAGGFSAQLVSHVFGGTPPYAYLWNNRKTEPFIDSLPIGTYHLVATDSLGITASFTIRIEEPMPLTISETVIQPQCPNPTNGAISLSVSGGVPPYQYHWNTSEQTAQLEGLISGIYDITATDANGCRKSQSISLQTPLAAHIEQYDTIRCSGDSNVTLQIHICGGVSPYKIRWNTGDSGLILSKQKSGAYYATIIDSIGYTVVATYTITEPQLLFVNGVQTDPICFGEHNGTITVSTIGGTPPYAYQWSNTTTASRLTNLSSGCYNLVVTDRNGCQSNYSTTLIDPEKPQIELGSDQILCHEQTFPISFSNDDFTYFWQKNGSFFHFGKSVNLSETGEYTVIAEDVNGCCAFDTLHIKSLSDRLDAEFWHSHEAIVDEDFIVVNIGQSSFDSVTWTISPSTRIFSQSDDYFHLRFSDTGHYEIRLTSHKNGCFETQSGLVRVISANETFRLKSATTVSLSNLKLFPNPAKDQFGFSAQTKKFATLNWILTRVETGVTVLSGQTKSDSNGMANQQISLHKQSRGVYVFRVFTGKEQISAQLIIY